MSIDESLGAAIHIGVLVLGIICGAVWQRAISRRKGDKAAKSVGGQIDHLSAQLDKLINAETTIDMLMPKVEIIFAGLVWRIKRIKKKTIELTLISKTVAELQAERDAEAAEKAERGDK